MADNETPTQPLIGAPSQQTAIDVGAPSPGGSSTRAYKVAGLTLLACVLIVGQGMIAYFLLSQRGDIKSLTEQNNKIQSQMSNGRSVSGPMRMHVPMKALPALMDDSVDEEASTGIQGKTDTLTQCQQEAAGLKPVQVPGFHPECDENGLYKAQQCFQRTCWCVNTATGRQIPGTVANGQAHCSGSFSTGGLIQSLPLSDFEA